MPPSHQLSPVYALTLSPEQREAAAIPTEASHFAFVYPCSTLEPVPLGDPPVQPGRGLADFRDVGGFVYFGRGSPPPLAPSPREGAAAAADGALPAAIENKALDWLASARRRRGGDLKPCKIFAVMPSKGKHLNFGKPIRLVDAWAEGAGGGHGMGVGGLGHRACFEQLRREKRLHDVTIADLCDKGVKQFCRLFPRECIGHGPNQMAGTSGVDGAKWWPHGAFVYFYDEHHGAHDCAFALEQVDGVGPGFQVRRKSSEGVE